MIKKTSFKRALHLWQNSQTPNQDHLSMDQLYKLSTSNGIQTADSCTLDHLSLCSECLDKWEDFSRLTNVDSDPEIEDEAVISYGFLKAASAKMTAPVFVKSRGKKFTLGIFPDMDRSDKGMAVLETLNEPVSYDGLNACVRDARGVIVLKSKIVNGRSASKIEQINTLDLSNWTIVLTKKGVIWAKHGSYLKTAVTTP